MYLESEEEVYMETNNKLSSIADEVNRKHGKQLNCDCMSEKVNEEETRQRIEGEFQRDFSRIMYSSSFRRLQGKMQLLRVKNDQFFRNRLTHSLEVSQIARSIARQLKYSENELFVVEAGAIAHDIGNPPFGHAGESMLNQTFEDIGGFEGNAQTLRILTTIEKKSPNFQGLNLSYRTLLSVVKYYKKKEEKNSKFIYDDDYNMLQEFIKKNDITVRTLDVQIVDLSDEIAYAAHDLEDGLRVKAFTIDEILHDYYSKYGDSDSYKKLFELVEAAKKKAGYGNVNVKSSEYSKLFRQELTSSIIYTLISDIDIVDTTNNFIQKTGTMNSKELGFKKYNELAQGLKEITFKCLTNTNDVFIYEKKGKLLLKYLSDFYTKNTELLPPEYRAVNNISRYSLQYDEKEYQRRLICDFISGMMDSYAISTYEEVSGKKFNNILGDLKDE